MLNANQQINVMIANGAGTAMTEKRFLEQEIRMWKNSEFRALQITGEEYYRVEHEILHRQRTAIGKDGALIPVFNLPNNKVIDNQYAKAVDQKTNYLLSKPILFETENEKYLEAIKKYTGSRFLRMIKNVGKDALNGAVAWVHPYYDDSGDLKFMRFKPYEILPFWKDAEHTELDAAIRLYEVRGYEGEQEVTIEKVEYYTRDGIMRYVLDNGQLIEDVENPSSSYITRTNGEGTVESYNWERIPLIPFRYNGDEIPLIQRVKSLQDGINLIQSEFMNNMQENARNTILILRNYDGENLGEFRQNLSVYGAVKVKGDGGLESLEVEVNAQNYESILKILKRALIENARALDVKDDRMGGNPNQMNIQSMYSDIDLDANEMETEFKAAFEDLFWFLNVHLANSGQGDFEGEEIEIIFNRDMLMNESEAITNCRNSEGILSRETIVSQHPWVNDTAQELERIEQERATDLERFSSYGSFGDPGAGGELNNGE